MLLILYCQYIYLQSKNNKKTVFYNNSRVISVTQRDTKSNFYLEFFEMCLLYT